MTSFPAASHYVCSLFGLSYESVGEVNQRFMQSQLYGGAYGGLLGGLGGLLGGLGGAAGLAGGAPPPQQRWECDPSAAAQQGRLYGHKQKLAAWLASPAWAELQKAVRHWWMALPLCAKTRCPAHRTGRQPRRRPRCARCWITARPSVPWWQQMRGRVEAPLWWRALGPAEATCWICCSQLEPVSQNTPWQPPSPCASDPAAFPGHFAPKLAALERCDPLRAVRLLLARGRPLVPACPVPHWQLPVLRLIGDFKAERGEFGILVSVRVENCKRLAGW